MSRRNYTAAKDGNRCAEDIVLRDKSHAQCMRPCHKLEHPELGALPYCTQHARRRGLLETHPIIRAAKEGA